jgi:hypothetical protein
MLLSSDFFVQGDVAEDSSGRSATKEFWNGFIKTYGSQRVTHFGDDVYIDYQVPGDYGMTCFYVMNPWNSFVRSPLYRPYLSRLGTTFANRETLEPRINASLFNHVFTGIGRDFLPNSIDADTKFLIK